MTTADTASFVVRLIHDPSEVLALRTEWFDLRDSPHLDRLNDRFAGGNVLLVLLAPRRIAHTTWIAPTTAVAHDDPVLRRCTDPDAGAIGPCFTHPDCRGRGAYPLALSVAATFLRAAGRRRALINTSTTNRPSQVGIRRAGFRAHQRVNRIRVGPFSAWRVEPVPGRGGHPLVWFIPELRQSGGGERIPLEGMEHFRRAGLDAMLVTYEFDPLALFGGRYQPRVIARPGTVRTGRTLATRAWGYLRRVAWLRGQLRRLRPAVVLTHGTWGQSVDLWLATVGTPIAYAVHVYGSVFATTWERTRYALVFRRHFEVVRRSVPSYLVTTPRRAPSMGVASRLQLEVFALLKWLSVRHAATRFVLSRRNAWEVERLYGCPAVTLKGAFPRAALDQQPPASPAAVFGTRPGDRIVLTVSRLVENKRVDLTMRGFALVAADDPSLQLVVGGTGEELSRLRALAEELGVAARVRFAGFVPESDLWAWYAACEVFVSMDLADFDIAPYEALAVGARVVWADEMEVDPALASYPALASARADPAAVAGAIRQVLAAPRPGPALRATLAPYAWERYFDDMLHELVAR
jgi:glycosyltransferase involved in cell wall biosynthesis